MRERHVTSVGGIEKRTLALVAGDLLAFLLFSVIGRRSHGMAVGPEAMIEVLETGAPFVLAWFLVAPLTGAFRLGLTPTQMAIRTVAATVLSMPVALLLRALALGRGSPLIFALVTGAVILALLVGWRTLFALWSSRRAA